MRATAAAYIFFRFFSVSIHFSQVAPASPDIKCKQSFLAAGLYDLTDAEAREAESVRRAAMACRACKKKNQEVTTQRRRKRIQTTLLQL